MEEKKIEDTIEEVSDDAVSAAEGTVENVQETADGIAEETDSHIARSDIEIKEDIEDEIRDIYDPTQLKGEAPNSKPVEVKKGKKPLKKGSIIAIVVAAAIVVACLIFIGFKVGWFDFLRTKIKLADTSRVEVYKEDVEVTNETIDYYVNSVLSSMATTETLEEGTIETGDTANIDYVGKLKSNGEAFDGGSAEGYNLSIGSGSFIEGFEDGLIGKSVGETVDLDLTFPEDYHAEHLKGQDVTFTVTINNIQRTTTPELTDEWVQDYSSKYCPETYNTVDEFREYAKDTITDYYLNNAVYQYVADNSEVMYYDQEQEQKLMEYSNETLTYYASGYGMDADSYASMSGYSSAEDYNKAMAHQYLDIATIVDEICKKNNVTYTEDELHAAIEQYMKDQKYIDLYSVDDFIAQSGETWIWMFTNLEFRFDKAMESLRDNVVVLEEKPTEEAVTTEPVEEEVEEALDEEVEEAIEDAESAADEAATVADEAATAAEEAVTAAEEAATAADEAAEAVEEATSAN